MIVVGTTLTTFSMLGGPDLSYLHDAWLMHAEEMVESHPEGVRFFAAIQVDKRGLEPFYPLTNRLLELGGAWWTYSLDDGRTEITQANRLLHLHTGQNLISTYATNTGATHLLHMAADCEADPQAIPKLLEVGEGVVASECTTYCFNEALLPQYAPIPVTGPPMTAVCVLIKREVFKRLRWRTDPEMGTTDDPSYTFDADTMLGERTVVRKDCVAIHHPETIGPIERRFNGLDLSVER